KKGCRSEGVAMKSVHEWGGGGSTIAALADIAGTTNYPVLSGCPLWKNVAQRIEEPSVSAATRQLCICHTFHGRKTKVGGYTKSDKVFEV
ncbi:hypothetical protein ALC62_04896, partial [Cyphomyrmex costatus]